METITLQYNNYLTETKLIDLFKQLSLLRDFKIETNVKIGERFRGDLVVDTHKNKYLIEFDGYQHFTDPRVILRDLKKDKIWLKENGTETIRIPYFMQLGGDYNFRHIFCYLLNDLNIEYITVNNNYPHGFIDSKAILPAGFCTLGIERFEKYLDHIEFKFDEIFHEKIIYSLLLKWKLEKIDKRLIFYKEFVKKYESSLEYVMSKEDIFEECSKKI